MKPTRRIVLAFAVAVFALSAQGAPAVGQNAPYAGGIDSIPSSDPADIGRAVNYVRQGLNESLAGRPLSVATSRPYGCSIKYS